MPSGRCATSGATGVLVMSRCAASGATGMLVMKGSCSGVVVSSGGVERVFATIVRRRWPGTVVCGGAVEERMRGVGLDDVL